MSTSPQSGREKEIFEQALDLPSAEARLGYVQGACGGDAGLLARVQTLLRAHEANGGFLPDNPAAASDPTVSHVQPEGPEKPGTIIGRYKLLENIGEGGFGSVYMAEQEVPIRRRVALKVIKLGMDTKEVVARFEAERQALALMDHPNIAKVLDGGATETGRPYFVMELVKGMPITAYCDQRKLSTAARLELFILVCQAVQHAHQKGIIHRDLKPSNILVTELDDRPVPKVIDFGVARATQARLTEKTMFTQFHQLVGTPAYMSPEQTGLANLDIDTRSDIYSLGVLLYELLTGCTPFDSKKLLAAGYEGIMRIIREVEPPKPSTRLSSLTVQELSDLGGLRREEPRRLGRSVQGDLDWIVMKALEKDRKRRYDTAGDFAADLRRHLAHEAVVARPPSAAYLLQKLLHRNRLAFAAGSAISAALIIGLAVSVWQAKRATQEAAIATAVSRFLNDDVLSQAGAWGQAWQGYTPEPNLTVHEALDRASTRLDTRFKDQPAVESELRLTIGRAYTQLSDYRAAIVHYERAVALRKTTHGANALPTFNTMRDLASAYREADRLPEAISLGEELLRLSQGKFGANSNITFRARIDLAEIYLAAGRRSEASAIFEETLRQSKARSGSDHTDNLDLMNITARAYLKVDRPADAIPLAEESARRSKQLRGPSHEVTFASMNVLARAYTAAGRHADSIPVLAEVLKQKKRTWGVDHPGTLDAMNGLALAYRAADRYADAISIFEEALQRHKLTLGADYQTTQSITGVLMLAYVHQQDYTRAEPLCRGFLAYRQQKHGVNSLQAARAMIELGQILVHLKKITEAESILRAALTIREEKEPDAWTTFYTHSTLGAALAGQEKYTEAEPLLVSGYEGMKHRESKIEPAARIRLKEALERLVQLYTGWGQPEKASGWQQQLDEFKRAEAAKNAPANLPAK